MVSDYFYLGMTLEVLNEDGQFIFLGKVADIDPDFIKIVNGKGDSVPPVLYNTPIKLRGFLSDTRPLNIKAKICGSAPDFWKINSIVGMYTHESRANFRQRVSIDTILLPANGIFGGKLNLHHNNHPVPCRILDVSAGGALVSCREEFEVGDWIFLPEVSVISELPPFSFTCQIRRQTSSPAGYLYGCQIEGLTEKEQDDLLSAIFAAQRLDLQKRRERGM